MKNRMDTRLLRCTLTTALGGRLMILGCVHNQQSEKGKATAMSDQASSESVNASAAEVSTGGCGYQLDLNPEVQATMMLAAAVSQLGAAIWGLAAVIAPATASSKPSAVSSDSAGAGGLPSMASAGQQEAQGNAANGKAEQPSAISYADVQGAITAVGNDVRYGHDGAMAILADFGVTHGKALKPEQYAAVVARCQQAMAGAGH